jgi:hypothetical protein
MLKNYRHKYFHDFLNFRALWCKTHFYNVFLEKYFGFSFLDILKMSIFQKPSDFLKEKNQKYILFIFQNPPDFLYFIV